MSQLEDAVDGAKLEALSVSCARFRRLDYAREFYVNLFEMGPTADGCKSEGSSQYSQQRMIYERDVFLRSALQLLGSSSSSSSNNLDPCTSASTDHHSVTQNQLDRKDQDQAEAEEDLFRYGILRKAALNAVLAKLSSSPSWTEKAVYLRYGRFSYASLDPDYDQQHRFTGSRPEKRKSVELFRTSCYCRPLNLDGMGNVGNQVFELTEYGGSRRLWLASSERERDDWVVAIRASMVRSPDNDEAMIATINDFEPSSLLLTSFPDALLEPVSVSVPGGRTSCYSGGVNDDDSSSRTTTNGSHSASHSHTSHLRVDCTDCSQSKESSSASTKLIGRPAHYATRSSPLSSSSSTVAGAASFYATDICRYHSLQHLFARMETSDEFVKVINKLRDSGISLRIPVFYMKSVSKGRQGVPDYYGQTPSIYSPVAEHHKQAWKDMQRDVIRLNGCTISGAEFGADAVIGSFISELMAHAKTLDGYWGTKSRGRGTTSLHEGSGGERVNPPPCGATATGLTEADALSHARNILALINRTQSGGDAYLCAESLFVHHHVEEAAGVCILTPSSVAQPEPMDIVVDVVEVRLSPRPTPSLPSSSLSETGAAAHTEVEIEEVAGGALTSELSADFRSYLLHLYHAANIDDHNNGSSTKGVEGSSSDRTRIPPPDTGVRYTTTATTTAASDPYTSSSYKEQANKNISTTTTTSSGPGSLTSRTSPPPLLYQHNITGNNINISSSSSSVTSSSLLSLHRRTKSQQLTFDLDSEGMVRLCPSSDTSVATDVIAAAAGIDANDDCDVGGNQEASNKGEQVVAVAVMSVKEGHGQAQQHPMIRTMGSKSMSSSSSTRLSLPPSQQRHRSQQQSTSSVGGLSKQRAQPRVVAAMASSSKEQDHCQTTATTPTTGTDAAQGRTEEEQKKNIKRTEEEETKKELQEVQEQQATPPQCVDASAPVGGSVAVAAAGTGTGTGTVDDMSVFSDLTSDTFGTSVRMSNSGRLRRHQHNEDRFTRTSPKGIAIAVHTDTASRGSSGGSSSRKGGGGGSGGDVSRPPRPPRSPLERRDDDTSSTAESDPSTKSKKPSDTEMGYLHRGKSSWKSLKKMASKGMGIISSHAADMATSSLDLISASSSAVYSGRTPQSAPGGSLKDQQEINNDGISGDTSPTIRSSTAQHQPYYSPNQLCIRVVAKSASHFRLCDPNPSDENSSTIASISALFEQSFLLLCSTTSSDNSDASRGSHYQQQQKQQQQLFASDRVITITVDAADNK